VKDATPLLEGLERRRVATTCAEVSRKPSWLRTIALPPPATARPPLRVEAVNRRFATDGARVSATATTAAL
jgi:hypothetical protein